MVRLRKESLANRAQDANGKQLLFERETGDAATVADFTCAAIGCPRRDPCLDQASESAAFAPVPRRTVRRTIEYSMKQRIRRCLTSFATILVPSILSTQRWQRSRRVPMPERGYASTLATRRSAMAFCMVTAI
jgi:hypothetical protein